MKIGYMSLFDKLESAESEAKIRYTYCLEKMGHQVFDLDSSYLFQGKRIDPLGLDLILTQDVSLKKDSIMPDVFSVFMFWTPSVFFHQEGAMHNIQYMDKCDMITCGYESPWALADVNANPSNDYQRMLLLPPSVPLDFCLAPQKKVDYKFFYVGMGLRYENLLKRLEREGRLELYGPRKNIFSGGKSPWHGFKSYLGPIKFDGKEIICRMNNAGIVLAFQGKCHTQQGFVSNRLFEGAAAGAIMIASENIFTRKYFGDSVFYVDINETEENIEHQVSRHIEYISSHPQESYEMAVRAQEIFKKELSLDVLLNRFFPELKRVQEHQMHQYNHLSGIDVICWVNSWEEYAHIEQELKKQILQNYHLIVCAPSNIMRVVNETKSHYTIDFIETEEFNGKIARRALAKLRGKYFLFLDGKTLLHRNHFYKLINLAEKTGDDFVYSGSFFEDQAALNSPMNFSSILGYLSSNWPDVDFTTNLQKKLFSACCLFNVRVVNDEKLFLLDNFHCEDVFWFFIVRCMGNMRCHPHFLYAMTVGKVLIHEDNYYNCVNYKTPKFIVEIKKLLLKNNFVNFVAEPIEQTREIRRNGKRFIAPTEQEKKLLGKIYSSKILLILMRFLSRRRRNDAYDENSQFLIYLNKHRKLKKSLIKRR